MSLSKNEPSMNEPSPVPSDYVQLFLLPELVFNAKPATVTSMPCSLQLFVLFKDPMKVHMA